MNGEILKQSKQILAKLSYEDFKKISEMLNVGGSEDEETMKKAYDILQSTVK